MQGDTQQEGRHTAGPRSGAADQTARDALKDAQAESIEDKRKDQITRAGEQAAPQDGLAAGDCGDSGVPGMRVTLARHRRQSNPFRPDDIFG